MLVSKAVGAVLALSMFTSARRIPTLPHAPVHLGGQAQGVESRHDASAGHISDIEPRNLEPGLAPRQAGNNNGKKGNNGDTCECQTKCNNKNFVIDPKNCSRCIRCPNNKVADPKSNYKKCVPDSGQHDDDKKARRDEKEKKWPEKKKTMTKKFKDKTPDRKKRNDERKAKRMSLCVPVALLGMESFSASFYMDGFFTEEYLESGEIREYWPEDLVIEEWELEAWDDSEEEKFYNGGYLDAWVDNAKEKWNMDEAGEESKLKVRDVDTIPIPVIGGHHQRGLQKRRFVIVAQVVSSIMRTGGQRYAQMVRRRFDGFFRSRADMKLGKDTPAATQAQAVQNLLKTGPLRWCLEKRTPKNHV